MLGSGARGRRAPPSSSAGRRRQLPAGPPAHHSPTAFLASCCRQAGCALNSARDLPNTCTGVGRCVGGAWLPRPRCARGALPAGEAQHPAANHRLPAGRASSPSTLANSSFPQVLLLACCRCKQPTAAAVPTHPPWQTPPPPGTPPCASCRSQTPRAALRVMGGREGGGGAGGRVGWLVGQGGRRVGAPRQRAGWGASRPCRPSCQHILA